MIFINIVKKKYNAFLVVYKIKNHKKESWYWSSFCNHVLEKRLCIDPSNNILGVSSHLKIQNEWPQVVLEWKASIYLSVLSLNKRDIIIIW